jgi:hypothetical protein
MTANVLRLAMWSGPRNISTAMMRAWENRDDCTVVDEPLYASYLHTTGIDHPGRDEVIGSGETDWRKVVETLLGPPPGGKAVWYQKHMCQHILQGMEIEWIHKLTNVFLIRSPEAVVASFIRVRQTDTIQPDEVGLPQQVRLFESVSNRLGHAPPVIDSAEFLEDPAGHLRALCHYLRIPFHFSMLNWPAGPRESDGIWAPYWYDSVIRSTGFEAPSPREVKLKGRAAEVAATCRPLYEELYQHRLSPIR